MAFHPQTATETALPLLLLLFLNKCFLCSPDNDPRLMVNDGGNVMIRNKDLPSFNWPLFDR